jgi:hypothetical protein
LKNHFENFADSMPIYYEEFQRQSVNYISDPLIVYFNQTAVHFNVKLNNFGISYVVVLKKTENLGKPSPF